jgi:hypothetical protein
MLDEFSVSVGIRSLVRSELYLVPRVSQLDICLLLQWIFKTLALNMKSLHTARFDVRNIKHSKLILEKPKAAEIIEKPQTPALRRFSVNHVHWEVSDDLNVETFSCHDHDCLDMSSCRHRGFA